MTRGHEPAGTRPAGRSPAHGFCDDEATRRLLRSRPPRQALAWAAAHLGGPVISARALRGGMSSAVHLLTILDGARQRRQAVLRRYVRPEVNTEDPDIAEREARALRAAMAVGVPPLRCSRSTRPEQRPGYPPCSCPGCPAGSTGGRPMSAAGCAA